MKQVKQTYLMLLIVISLFSLAIYSTYAMFTTQFNTDDIVSINTTISLDTNVKEYEILTIEANEYKTLDINISNTKEKSLYYGVWYEILSGSDYDFNAYKLNTSQSLTVDIIDVLGTKNITIALINNSHKKITIKLGLETSENEALNLIEGRTLITEEILEENLQTKNAAEFLKHIAENNKDNVYKKDEKIIYYGENPNNYIIFNQELWRIISISNNRLKLISTTSIGYQPFNIEISNLEKSNINNILNTLYYNAQKGECYNNAELTECDFSQIGLDKDVKDILNIQNLTNEFISTPEEIITINNISTIVESNFENYISLITYKDYYNTFNCQEEICEENSWLTIENLLLSTLNKTEDNTYSISINEDGTIKTNNLINEELVINPVIELKENIFIKKGNGTKDNPYIIL